jgi:hypothetical protein
MYTHTLSPSLTHTLTHTTHTHTRILLFDERCGNVPGDELLVLIHVPQEGDVVGDPADHVLVERLHVYVCVRLSVECV